MSRHSVRSVAAGIALFTLAAAPSDAQFRVIGYMPSWSGSVSSVQYDKLTTINYAFGNPSSNGVLQPIPNPAKLRDLVSTAHGRGVKVVLSLGGWNDGNDSAFENLARSASTRTAFVNSCVNVLNEYNLDGIDVDWEYPDPGQSATNYAAMMSQLCDAMHARGKTCSAAVISHGSQGGGVPASVFSFIDYIMLMAYDGGAGSANSPYSLAVQSMDYWQGRGLPASKTVLGVPFYGRGPSFSQYRLYNEIVRLDPSAPTKDMSGGYGYNGIATIKRKTQLALERGGGIMNWELSGDATGSASLLTAMHEVIHGGGTPTPTPRPTPTPTPTVTPTPRPTPTPLPGGVSEVTPPASGVTASANDGNLPGNVVDNNLGTRWSASGDGQWLQLDLGAVRSLVYAKIAFYNGVNGRRSRFDLQVSPNGVDWANVLTNVQSSGTSTVEETFDFADTPARWVRYVGHGNSVNLWNSLTEVSLFASNDATPTPTVAPTATPTPTSTPGGIVEITPPASRVTASTSDINVPGNTVDNNLATRWSGNGDGAWIEYDLGANHDVSYVRIAVYNGNARRNTFDLQVAGADRAFTTIVAGAQTSGTTTQEETYDFDDVTARYLRYLGHQSNVGTFNSVTEVSIFGRPLP